MDCPDFNLAEGIASVRQALLAIVCHTGFEAAVYGLAMAAILLSAGLAFRQRQLRFGPPLVAVARKVAIFCIILAVPGGICLAVSGCLPPTGNLEVTGLAFVAFWSLVCLHLSAEEMNFQWF